jgi:hypothetical protein
MERCWTGFVPLDSFSSRRFGSLERPRNSSDVGLLLLTSPNKPIHKRIADELRRSRRNLEMARTMCHAPAIRNNEKLSQRLSREAFGTVHRQSGVSDFSREPAVPPSKLVLLFNAGICRRDLSLSC